MRQKSGITTVNPQLLIPAFICLNQFQAFLLKGDSYKKEAYISIFQTDHIEQLRHILCQLEPSKMYWLIY